MYIIYFSWWREFRVPPTTTKVKVATAGKAFGVWNDTTNIFQFKLPLGVCTADVAFMGTSGTHEFHFTVESAEASHVAWEHMDYEHTSDAFPLERAFSCCRKHLQIVELPLPRVAEFSRYHNPTRPFHLVQGTLVRHQRSYSPNEIRSVQTMGLEQSPTYFTTRENSRNRARSLSQPRSISGRDRQRSIERSRPLLVKEHRESLLEEETLDLHLVIEVGLDLHTLQEYIQTPFGKEE